MDEGFFRRIVREMREAGVEELGVFYLGESFLCPWLAEAIRYAKARRGISLCLSDHEWPHGDG